MLTDKELKIYSTKTGMSVPELKKSYETAGKEAKSMGKGKDEDYIISVFEEIIELDEKISIPKLVTRFIESDYTDFNLFLEGLEGSDIPLDMRPELHLDPEDHSDETVNTTAENVGEVEDTQGLIERNLDGTGPDGEGPMTGRGMGQCLQNEDEIIDPSIAEDLLKYRDDPDKILDIDKKSDDKKQLFASV